MNGIAAKLEALAVRLDHAAPDENMAATRGPNYALGHGDGCDLGALLIREFIAAHEERTTSPDLTVEGGPPSVPPKGAA